MALLESIIAALSFLATILGYTLIVLIILSAIIIFIVLVLLAYSFRTGNMLFPNQVILGIMFFEGSIKAVFRLFGMDDSLVDKLSIDLQNKTMMPAFSRVPFNKRAVFIPQCLRSVECPARLSPSGIKCMSCGRCDIKNAKQEAEKLGYSFFVVPGSSFIVHMIKECKPQAIIGVGCMAEVKEGLDMMHKHRIPAVGVILDRAGCVSTVLDWDKLYQVMNACESSDPVEKKDGIGQ